MEGLQVYGLGTQTQSSRLAGSNALLLVLLCCLLYNEECMEYTTGHLGQCPERLARFLDSCSMAPLSGAKHKAEWTSIVDGLKDPSIVYNEIRPARHGLCEGFLNLLLALKEVCGLSREDMESTIVRTDRREELQERRGLIYQEYIVLNRSATARIIEEFKKSFEKAVHAIKHESMTVSFKYDDLSVREMERYIENRGGYRYSDIHGSVQITIAKGTTQISALISFPKESVCLEVGARKDTGVDGAGPVCAALHHLVQCYSVCANKVSGTRMCDLVRADFWNVFLCGVLDSDMRRLMVLKALHEQIKSSVRSDTYVAIRSIMCNIVVSMDLDSLLYPYSHFDYFKLLLVDRMFLDILPAKHKKSALSNAIYNGTCNKAILSYMGEICETMSSDDSCLQYLGKGIARWDNRDVLNILEESGKLYPRVLVHGINEAFGLRKINYCIRHMLKKVTLGDISRCRFEYYIYTEEASIIDVLDALEGDESSASNEHTQKLYWLFFNATVLHPKVLGILLDETSGCTGQSMDSIYDCVVYRPSTRMLAFYKQLLSIVIAKKLAMRADAYTVIKTVADFASTRENSAVQETPGSGGEEGALNGREKEVEEPNKCIVGVVTTVYCKKSTGRDGSQDAADVSEMLEAYGNDMRVYRHELGNAEFEKAIRQHLQGVESEGRPLEDGIAEYEHEVTRIRGRQEAVEEQTEPCDALMQNQPMETKAPHGEAGPAVLQPVSLKGFLDAIKGNKRRLLYTEGERDDKEALAKRIVEVSIIYAMISNLEDMKIERSLSVLDIGHLEDISIHECFGKFSSYSKEVRGQASGFEKTEVGVMLSRIKSMKESVEDCVSRVYEIGRCIVDQWYSFVNMEDEDKLDNPLSSVLNTLTNMKVIVDRSPAGYRMKTETVKQMHQEIDRLFDEFLEHISTDAVTLLVTNIFVESILYYGDDDIMDYIMVNKKKIQPACLYGMNKLLTIRQFFLLLGFISTYDGDYNDKPAMMVALRKWLDGEYF